MHYGTGALNRPGLFVYGGTIKPGAGHTDIISVFEAVGQHAKGEINEIQVKQIEEVALPGAGSCGGMYTANSMASAIEALGMSLPGLQHKKLFLKIKWMTANVQAKQS